MYRLTLLLFILLLSAPAWTQVSNNLDKIAGIKKELRELMTAWSDARIKHDRPALERIYADEFIIIHAAGFAENKTATINEIMETDSIRAIPAPDFENLTVYGDVAIFRQPSNQIGNTVAGGRAYSTYIYVRKASGWQIAQAQGTALQPERKIVKLDAAVLDAFAGKYERMGQFILISRSDSILMLNMVNRGIPKRKLSPVSDTRFFDKPGSEYTFLKDDKEKVTHFVIKFANGIQSEWKKVE